MRSICHFDPSTLKILAKIAKTKQSFQENEKITKNIENKNYDIKL